MTEYTVSAEASVPVALTGAELIGIMQAGKYYQAKVSDVMAAAVTLSGVTIDNATLVAPVVFTGLATQSMLISTTKSARVGFYGAAGTSQRAGAVQAALSCTAFSPTTASSVIGFSSTVQFSNTIGLLVEIRQALVDAGILAGS